MKRNRVGVRKGDIRRRAWCWGRRHLDLLISIHGLAEWGNLGLDLHVLLVLELTLLSWGGLPAIVLKLGGMKSMNIGRWCWLWGLLSLSPWVCVACEGS